MYNNIPIQPQEREKKMAEPTVWVKKKNVFWAVVAGFFDSVLTSILIIISVIGTLIVYVAHGLVVWILSGLRSDQIDGSYAVLSVVVWILMYIPILVGSIDFRLRGKILPYVLVRTLVESLAESFGSKTKEKTNKPSE